ncbi:hypothetical protein PsorP6_010793 [Peronosclerospora sorghi]|uniref:Uncharacterized protein n=1 Tax=Peronosclerospora sorghi TaxID=230839 RepID=A0ACC0VWP3_9STRA|nr:hypothetical protein PsorP6_010793 [Peronosclerospora sorghi]
MMTLPTTEVPPPPSSSTGVSTAFVVKEHNDMSRLSANESDLELHLLQTFAAYTSNHLIQSYQSVKHASRLTRYVANVTERLATRLGLVTLVQFLFHQYMRLGHPFVQQVDSAMGKRVIDAVVNVLMLADQRPVHEQRGILALEAGSSSSQEDAEMHETLLAASKLSYAERFQALLLGVVPRMEQELIKAHRRAQDEANAKAEEAARLAPAPLVLELKDFVPVDEVVRLKEENKEQLEQALLEATTLRMQIAELAHEKQQLEQQLTDVHNYKESEHGRRFQELEDELARTKLTSNQRAFELSKLEVFVQELKRKQRKKRKSRKGDSQYNASESSPPSTVAEKSPERVPRTRENSRVSA